MPTRVGHQAATNESSGLGPRCTHCARGRVAVERGRTLGEASGLAIRQHLGFRILAYRASNTIFHPYTSLKDAVSRYNPS